ncbi:hypothetical protein GGS20DRAFT_583253 [Poronia punctata]|nr:hypothetical protein GGS20DRAFT_583253 [Poronia punctata]
MHLSTIIISAIYLVATSVTPTLAAAPAADLNPLVIECNNKDQYDRYLKCFLDNAGNYCAELTSSTSSNRYQVCLQQWQSHCGK